MSHCLKKNEMCYEGENIPVYKLQWTISCIFGENLFYKIRDQEHTFHLENEVIIE